MPQEGCKLKNTRVVGAVAIAFLLLVMVSGCNGEAIDEPTEEKTFVDGTYRGAFIDRGDVQVNIQFTLEDNVFTDSSYRHLYYGGIDYLESEDEAAEAIRTQHMQVLEQIFAKAWTTFTNLVRLLNI